MTSSVQVFSPTQLGPAIAPYSQAAIANGFVYIAGQVALDPHNQVVAPGDARAQTSYAVSRIRIILAETGATLEDIVSATVFIASLDHFGPFNEGWATAFGDHRPARATVVAGLLIPGLVVEIQAVAALPR